MLGNSLSSLDSLEKKDSPRKEKCVLLLYFAYSVTFLALLAAFITWLIDERHQTRREVAPDSDRVWVETTPTFIAIGIALVVAPLMLIVCCIKQDAWPSECFYADFGHWFNYIPVCWMGVGIFFAIQIIVFMCTSAKEQLSLQPPGVSCYCVTPALTSVTCTSGATWCSAGALSCQCRVPRYDTNFVVAVKNVNEIDKSLLAFHKVDWDGQIQVLTKQHALTEEDVPWLKERPHFKAVFLLVQLSFVLAILRVPLDVGSSYVLDNGEREGIYYVIEAAVTSLYIITESLDASSLLEEIPSNPGYFVNNAALANAVLAFVSIAILWIHALRVPRALQMALLLVTNIGFLAIRSVLFEQMSEKSPMGDSKSRVQLLMLLFIVKDIALIFCALVHLLYDLLQLTCCSYCTETRVVPITNENPEQEEAE